MTAIHEKDSPQGDSTYLYHGTSAGNALRILASGRIEASADGHFYCFDSDKPESLAGALNFAMAGGYRDGSFDSSDVFDRYVEHNPDFPTGLKGHFAKAALKKVGEAWAKAQRQKATTSLDDFSAIMVFRKHEDALSVTRLGFVNEVKVPAEALDELDLVEVYIDDALMRVPSIRKLADDGVPFKPISLCLDRVRAKRPGSGSAPHTGPNP